MNTDMEYFDSWVATIPDFISDLNLYLRDTSIDGMDLDFSLDSIDRLEAWLLQRFKSIVEFKESEKSGISTMLAAYIGETIRKHCKCKWVFQTNPSYIYYKLPVVEFSNGDQESPHCMVTTSLDRRTGNLIRDVIESYLET